MPLIYTVVKSSCAGYRCNEITGIHYEIENWSDEHYKIVSEGGEWINQECIRSTSENPSCLKCIQEDNYDHIIQVVLDTPHWSAKINSGSKSLLTVGTFTLNDVEGKPYIQSSFICMTTSISIISHNVIEPFN